MIYNFYIPQINFKHLSHPLKSFIDFSFRKSKDIDFKTNSFQIPDLLDSSHSASHKFSRIYILWIHDRYIEF